MYKSFILCGEWIQFMLSTGELLQPPLSQLLVTRGDVPILMLVCGSSSSTDQSAPCWFCIELGEILHCWTNTFCFSIESLIDSWRFSPLHICFITELTPVMFLIAFFVHSLKRLLRALSTWWHKQLKETTLCFQCGTREVRLPAKRGS